MKPISCRNCGTPVLVDDGPESLCPLCAITAERPDSEDLALDVAVEAEFEVSHVPLPPS